MTAQIAELIDVQKNDPSQREAFFDEDEMKRVRDYIRSREFPDLGFPPSCDVNLFFGFFFDGTNNNMMDDTRTHEHTTQTQHP